VSKSKKKKKSNKALPSQQKESIYHSGLFHFRSGNYNKAINIWRGISKDSDLAVSHLLAEAHFRNALSIYERDNASDAISEMHSVLKYDSSLPVYLYHTGLAYHRAGKFPQAISYYTRAVQAAPGDERYRYHLAIAYLQNKEFQNSLNVYESLGGTSGYVGKALVYIAQGDYKKAMELLDARESKGEVNLLKGLIYLIQGEDSGSKNYFRAAANDEATKGIANYYLGIAHARTQAMPSAIKAWEDAFRSGLSIQLIRDDMIDVYHQLVPIYFDRGNLGKAVNIWEKLIELDPEDVETKRNLVHAYFLKGNEHAISERFTYAVKYWHKAYELDPTNPDLAHNMALAYEKQEKPALASKYWQEAAKGWKREISRNPDKANALKARLHSVHSHLATMALELDNIGKAVEEFREALSYVPDDVDTMSRLSYLYIINRDFGKAIRELEKAYRLDPKNIDILHQMSVAYAMKGNMPRSADCIRELLKIDPGNELYKNLMKDYYLARARDAQDDGKYKFALGFLEDALEVLPDNIELQTMVGGVYLGMKEVDKAEDTFEKVIASNQKDPKVYLAIGHQYLENEMIEPAESYFAQAIELEPDNPYLYVDIADQYCDVDMCKNANRYFEKAKDKGAGDIKVLIRIVEQLLQRECGTYSIEYAKELVESYPENTRSYYLLGTAYHIDGMNDEAEKVLKQGRDMAAENKDYETLDNFEKMLHHVSMEKNLGVSWEDMLKKLEDIMDDFDMDDLDMYEDDEEW